MIKLELNEQDRDNLLFCLLYTLEIIADPKMPIKEYRTQLMKWIEQLVEDMKIQGEFNDEEYI